MTAITQNEIIALIAEINDFADRAERLISDTQTTYEARKNAMLSAQNAELESQKNVYSASCAELRRKTRNTVDEAKRIYAEIETMDKKLSQVDKYYVKTKKKKLEALAGTTSEKYAGSTDYFEALNEIKKKFNALYKKYSEDILPGLINGLNFLFSSQRKKDYEDLIVLKNSVSSFVSEIDTLLPQLADETLSDITAEYSEHRQVMEADHASAREAFENSYLDELDAVAAKICDDLDTVLPDEFVDYLHAISASYYNTLTKVNASDTVTNDILDLCHIEYPVELLVGSQIVAGIIKEKCKKLLVDDVICFPMVASVKDAPVWMIRSSSSSTAVQGFTHSIMFGYLSSCPVEKLTYTVIDPENRGNSISPFFDAKKKLPELFGEKIYIGREEVAITLSRLNEKISDILQNKLGNQYDSIFDYAKSMPDYKMNAELVILYDFPKGFDDRMLSELRNILRNGSRCGVYTLISYVPNDDNALSKEFQQSLQTVVDMCTVIDQQDDTFIHRGLTISCAAMPERAEFSKFFSKYMLIYEGMKNRGIAFPPLIRKLAEAKDTIELDEHINYIHSIVRTYEQNYATVPPTNTPFPALVTLGSVMYPADIFSDSVGYRRIVETFGKTAYGNTENTAFVELPLAFDLRSAFNLFLSCPEERSREMLQFTHHVIWSFLSVMPVTKTNICVFDPEQRGNSIIPFLEFRKRSADTFDQKIYTSQDAMHERLQKINAQIDEFIQEKLGNKFRDILEYNINTPNRAEAITLLLIYDFPGAMDGRSIDLLTNILRNGNKCGVYTIICHNPNISFSRYENIDERIEQLMRFCASVDYKDGHYALLPYNLQISIPNPVPPNTIDSFVGTYVEEAETIKKQGLSFRDILAKELFSMDASKSLRIPIGVGDGDSIISMSIGEGSSHHGLIAGATGSGKSTLLHTLIMSGMLHYSPDELHLYLMDFKSGTEFKIYESVKLPHIQLLALDAMQEFGESILENLVSEMERRGNLFKDAGQTSLKGYKAATGQSLPRILVIMDEFQILFNDATNRKVAMNCAELTKRIVTEGRAFGIHLLMATQSTKVISDLTLSHGTIEQMRIRVGMKCGENDARYLFSDQNDTKALAMMKGPIGTAVMNEDYTEQPNIGFRAAYCDSNTQREYLELISKTYADRPYTLQTFEGGRTTGLLDYFTEANIGRTEELPVQIHMGTLIKVAPPFAISIDKKKKHNLLICGANERMANLISNDYIVSALLNRNASVFCIDGDKLVGDDGSADFYNALNACSGNFKVAESRGDIICFINDVYKKYQAWKKQNSDEVIFVVIKNLQFLDIIQAMLKGEAVDESEFVEDTQQPAEETSLNPFAAVTGFFENRSNEGNISVGEKLLRLISDGSGFGIHFVISSLEYQTVKECMHYGENTLPKFPERIIFSLGANDADSLIENVSVAGLRDNTVYFTDGVKKTFQMKPYIMPKTEELPRIFR